MNLDLTTASSLNDIMEWLFFHADEAGNNNADQLDKALQKAFFLGQQRNLAHDLMRQILSSPEAHRAMAGNIIFQSIANTMSSDETNGGRGQ